MTERELWAKNLRAINRRIDKHVSMAWHAQQEARLVLAYYRDAGLTPIEAAYAGAALDECLSTHK